MYYEKLKNVEFFNWEYFHIFYNFYHVNYPYAEITPKHCFYNNKKTSICNFFLTFLWNFALPCKYNHIYIISEPGHMSGELMS